MLSDLLDRVAVASIAFIVFCVTIFQRARRWQLNRIAAARGAISASDKHNTPLFLAINSLLLVASASVLGASVVSIVFLDSTPVAGELEGAPLVAQELCSGTSTACMICMILAVEYHTLLSLTKYLNNKPNADPSTWLHWTVLPLHWAAAIGSFLIAWTSTLLGAISGDAKYRAIFLFYLAAIILIVMIGVLIFSTRIFAQFSLAQQISESSSSTSVDETTAIRTRLLNTAASAVSSSFDASSYTVAKSGSPPLDPNVSYQQGWSSTSGTSAVAASASSPHTATLHAESADSLESIRLKSGEYSTQLAYHRQNQVASYSPQSSSSSDSLSSTSSSPASCCCASFSSCVYCAAFNCSDRDPIYRFKVFLLLLTLLMPAGIAFQVIVGIQYLDSGGRGWEPRKTPTILSPLTILTLIGFLLAAWFTWLPLTNSEGGKDGIDHEDDASIAGSPKTSLDSTSSSSNSSSSKPFMASDGEHAAVVKTSARVRKGSIKYYAPISGAPVQDMESSGASSSVIDIHPPLDSIRNPPFASSSSSSFSSDHSVPVTPVKPKRVPNATDAVMTSPVYLPVTSVPRANVHVYGATSSTPQIPPNSFFPPGMGPLPGSYVAPMPASSSYVGYSASASSPPVSSSAAISIGANGSRSIHPVANNGGNTLYPQDPRMLAYQHSPPDEFFDD